MALPFFFLALLEAGLRLAGYGFANRPNTLVAIENLRAQSAGLAFTDNSSIGGGGTPSRGREVPRYDLDMFQGGPAWNPMETNTPIPIMLATTKAVAERTVTGRWGRLMVGKKRGLIRLGRGQPGRASCFALLPW